MKDDVDSSESVAKARVKQAALTLFSEHGFQVISVRDIMRACDLTAGALYAHFESKEELLFALILEGHTRLQRRLDAISRIPAPAPQRLARLCYLQTIFQLKNLELARIAMTEYRYLPDNLKEKLRSVRTAMTKHFDNVLEAGIVEGYFELSMPLQTRMGLLAVANTAPQWFSPTGPVAAEDIAREHADSALRIAMTKGARAVEIRSIVSESLQIMELGWEGLKSATQEIGKSADAVNPEST